MCFLSMGNGQKTMCSSFIASVTHDSAFAMNLIPASIQDLAIIRRAIFASNYLPKECPNYWSIVTAFATRDGQLCKDVDDFTIKGTIENLQLMNPMAFSTDCQLVKEIHAVHRGKDEPLGVVLISPNSECGECHAKLHIRKDRPSHVIVYTELVLMGYFTNSTYRYLPLISWCSVGFLNKGTSFWLYFIVVSVIVYAGFLTVTDLSQK